MHAAIIDATKLLELYGYIPNLIQFQESTNIIPFVRIYMSLIHRKRPSKDISYLKYKKII